MSAMTTDDRQLAVWAQSLYLVNLLLLPGIGFMVLIGLYWRYRQQPLPLAAGHLRQTVAVSLWAGALLVGVSGLIVLIGGADNMLTWVVVIPYFVVCHAALVLGGALGLARALAGQDFRFPLLGPARPSSSR